MTKTESAFRSEAHITPERMRILLRRVDHSTPMLAVIAKIMEAVNNSAAPQELSEVIQRSPELAMKVVRVANSAAFGNRRAESVREAIDFLGWQRIVTIATTIGMREQSEEVLAESIWSAETFQRRCVALAFVSQLLAKRIDPWCEEKYYMSGLFQEWGYLVLAQHAPAYLEPVGAVIGKTAVDSPIEVEHFYIGTDHAELGAIAAEEYGLAPEVAASIRFHHQPALAPEEFQLAADVAHVASWVVGELGIHVFPGATNHRLDPFAVLRMGWNPEAVDEIKQAILHATHAVSSAMAEA